MSLTLIRILVFNTTIAKFNLIILIILFMHVLIYYIIKHFIQCAINNMMLLNKIVRVIIFPCSLMLINLWVLNYIFQHLCYTELFIVIF